jgi:DNA adenine methylase
LDFNESIVKHDKVFKYLDPPYIIEGALYGKDGSTHKDFDHQGLFNLLNKTDNWIMSYNNCEEIRSLYKDYQMIEPVWAYGMSKNKRSNELLIFSKDIKSKQNGI